ncbi:TlpA family protein disulfide reductase [Deinococcus navajonensis]|uniref:TlpA family protein disulfide reductase n=1 Tax=Deinococcus navajonensis TaxID=309884 RepID=A0ABV8XKG3_9DEIO
MVGKVRTFLDGLSVFDTTFVDDGALRQALQVSGYPSTFVIDQTGQETARHLGPVSSVQLQALLRRAKENQP